ncbi:vWA domain-containing protein [Alteromonas oceanisediminis]|uniref:vWA domain-containing protein n=1 Tax=Alteromonas oceanisediminis TaxID=2836180 RepID=UPI001BD9CADC|nr:VWA domain-containing protein [Alteromonas oceanisediminis]MBT0587516.1 VWA domain-containing protein [Alteromonas oceanisediminis]
MTVDWQSLHFIRPEWLWALLPLCLAVVGLRFIQRHSSGWQRVLPTHLHRALLGSNTSSKKTSAPPLWLLALCWLFAVIALAGPTWEKLPQPVYNVKQGNVIVIDMSLSMRATDISPSRLERARFKAIDLIKALGDGEIGMVAYAGDAFVVSPLTEDANNVINLIPSLSPEIMPIPGSEPLRGFEVASELLDNAGYTQGNLFWFTDGIDNTQYAALAEFVEQSDYRLHTLAIGTQQGAPIQQLSGELLKDSNRAIVIPKTEPARLRAVSQRGSGEFTSLTASDADIQTLISHTAAFDDSESTSSDSAKGDVWQDMGPFLAILLLPFAAYAFRRGLIFSFMLTVLFLAPLGTPVAVAQSTDTQDPVSWLDSALKTDNQRAQQAYDAANFEHAANLFNDPMWAGAAHYKAGDYAAALDSYSQVESVAARYNQGNALAQLGKLKEAIAAYDDVIAQQPDHQRAIENKALLEQLLEQQQQSSSDQSNEDNQQQDSEQTDGESQSDSSSQNNGEDNGESGDQENQSSENNQGQSEQEQADMRENQAPPESSEREQSPQSDQPDAESDTDSSDAQSDMDTETENEPAASELDSAVPDSEQPLTDEEREQLQRMQNLLRRVPDDPAFLLQRKMQLENQQRRRERAPPTNQKNW